MNPIGRRFGGSNDRGDFEILGVVGDAKYGSLREPAPPVLVVENDV